MNFSCKRDHKRRLGEGDDEKEEGRVRVNVERLDF